LEHAVKNSAPNIKGYQVLERVGVGLGSTIYKVRKEDNGELRAIKYVELAGPENRSHIGNLRNGYEKLMRIQRDSAAEGPHPNIVMPVELRVQRALFRIRAAYMVMEYIPGRSLAVEHDHPLAELIAYFLQIGDALAFMHRRALVHGDVKLDNILVRPDGVAKLIDFGFCCPRNTRLTGVRGTRSYIAPEQVEGGVVTELTDVYNFGASMYRALTHQHLPLLIPFESQRNAEFISGIHVKPDPVHELHSEVPRPLSNIVMECCRRDPAQRPRNMDSVLERLRRQAPLR